jgi:hypothetical protein
MHTPTLRFCKNAECGRKCGRKRVIFYIHPNDPIFGTVEERKPKYDYNHWFFKLPGISWFAQPTSDFFVCRITASCDFCQKYVKLDEYKRHFNRFRIISDWILGKLGFISFSYNR